MKSMTCKQMGGPCETLIHGNTPEEMMKIGEAHLVELKDLDEGHKKAYEMMEELSKNPAEGKKWNDDFVAKFNSLPQN